MRDIKFRAFIKELKRIDDVVELYCDGDVMTCSYPYRLESNDIELMQYTGLKDKNGVEIYEGYIVAKKGVDCNSEEYRAWMANTDYSDDVDSDLEKQIPIVNQVVDVVTMERFPRYWLKNESFGYEGEDLEEPSLFEVIGNIYENPELINQ